MHVSSFFIVVVFALVTHMARLSGNVSFVKAAFLSSSSSSIVVRKKSVVPAAATSRPTTTAAAAAVWGQQQQQQQRSAAAAGRGGGRGVLLGISTMMMMKNHNCINNNRGNNGVVVASFHSRRTTTTTTTRRRTSRLSAAAESTTTTTTTSSSSTTEQEQEQEAGESTAEEEDYNDDDDDNDDEMIRRAVGEFDIQAYFASQLPAIEEALQESVQSTMKETDTICESMSYSLMAGGKRIRPILCLAAAEMFINSNSNNNNNDSENDNKEQDIDSKIRKQLVYEKAMPTAVALEMIHTMSLIHDDLPSMDNDDLRRGKPTNHVVYGEDVAILAGDALLSTSFQHVAEKTVGVDSDKVLDVIVRLGKSVGPIGLAGGQVMDLQCEGKPSSDVTIDDLRWIHTHKTATLLQVAIASGATLGGATNNEVKACEEFALNIGLAFQVADDILDVTQSTEELGKTAGKDIDSDKVTYPRLLGLDGARMEAKKLIEKAKSSMKPFGNRAIPLLALADFIINRTN